MGALIGRKLLTLVPVLLAVSLLTYLLLNLLPGDPALLVLGPQAVSADSIAAVRSELGLDRPLPVRYAMWLGDAVTGDLGQSYITRQDVTSAITDRLPVTLELMVLSLLMALVIAIPLGVFSAYRVGSRFDKSVTGVTFGLLALPNFIFALVLIFAFSVRVDLFPASGWDRISDGLGANLLSAFLPALALSVSNIAVFTRLLRTDMITTLQEDHVTLARSKGLPTSRILFRHALRPQLVLAADRGGPAGRVAAVGDRDRRDDLRPAGRGPAAVRRHQQPRPAHGPGRGAHARGVVRADQLRGRPALHLPRPPHPVWSCPCPRLTRSPRAPARSSAATPRWLPPLP